MTQVVAAIEPTRILLVRHGETDWNRAQRIQGHIDIALNEVGQAQARKLGQALADEPISAIYASDLNRAHVTAHAVARHQGLELRTEPALRERNYGVFEGLTFAEIETQWPEQAVAWRRRDPEFAPEAGESLVDLVNRVMPAVQAIGERHPGEQVMLVTHGGVIDVIYRAASRMDLSTKRTWELTNTAVNRLLWTPLGLTLVGWGDTRHLDDGSRDELAA